ncbi:HK97 family phage prohead protease [Bradyrhizobium sp. NP1]|uniref:HK97 family phage prohead protease n=1 Tax=Bradyrhizobium sp. NP1 TaxID=3049772 RepID=UPI0025A58D0D|nr:HK97 family phage prohead protease [Bradyrhizobium sp. NP1]WJR76005.1 HK97 family phage prohead protease [Bradyrhizobium sp. NP1]
MDKLEIKATLGVTDAGEIIGTAWPFGSPDSVGDIIVKGAFGSIAPDMPMLFKHSPSDLIGTWTEIAETPDGLVVKGKMHMEQPRARSVLSMIKSGLVDGLSIGFKTLAATRQGRNRVITAVDLKETSIVPNPAHPKARIISAKANDSALAVAELINRFAAALT